MPNIIMCDPKGGDPYEIAREILNKTIVEYVDEELTYIGTSGFRSCTQLTKLWCPNLTNIGASVMDGCSGLISLVLFITSTLGTLGSLGNLENLDLVNLNGIPSNFFSVPKLKNLILRKTTGVCGTSASAMNNTPMKSGGSGCTVYIPKALYDHLGDGTSLDYKANSSWAPYDGYGTITWAQIEGSIYENQYADGTPIQTGG